MKAIHTRLMLRKIDIKKYNLEPTFKELAELERLAEIGRALEWAVENKQSSWVSVVDTPRGSFCNGLDIDFLLKLAKEEYNYE